MTNFNNNGLANLVNNVRPDHNTRKIAQQFAIEFFLPFLLAAAWTWADWDRSKTAFQMLSIGGVHFFAVGWFFSNWNRIKKQSRNEAGMTGIEKKVEEVIKNLETSTDRMIGFSTGGDSFCEFTPTPLTQLVPDSFALIHRGKYPLYDVTVRVVDLERLTKTAPDLAKEENIYNFDLLVPQHVVTIKLNSPTDRIKTTPHRYNIFVTARNGSTEQMFQMTLVNGMLRTASNIERDGKIILDDAAKDYPRNENGQVDWTANLLKTRLEIERDIM